MSIVKEIFRLAATVWLILLMAIIIDFMTESADACGSPDCVPTSTPYSTGTLVPTEVLPTDTPYPTETEEPDDDDDDSTRTPEPTETKEPEPSDTPKPTNTEEPDDPTRTPEPTAAPELTSTPDPTPVPKPTDDSTRAPDPTDVPTERPHDCHVDGDGICPGEETPAPVVILPLPPMPIPTGTLIPTPVPTETSRVMVQVAAACPDTCCSACCGCFEQAGVGSEVDYSDVILEFKPLAFILIGIFGANTLLKTYGTFRKD